MMIRRAALLVFLATCASVTAEARVELPAVCLRGSSFIFASPGVQLTSTSGPATSIDPSTGVTTGTMSDCRGTIEGQRLDPRRSGSFEFRATYGVGRLSDAIGYTCFGGSGEGKISFTFPLENGRTLRRHGTLAWNRAEVLLLAGGTLGHSSTWHAPMVLRPVEGDCYTTPLSVIWMTGVIVVSSSG